MQERPVESNVCFSDSHLMLVNISQLSVVGDVSIVWYCKAHNLKYETDHRTLSCALMFLSNCKMFWRDKCHLQLPQTQTYVIKSVSYLESNKYLIWMPDLPIMTYVVINWLNFSLSTLDIRGEILNDANLKKLLDMAPNLEALRLTQVTTLKNYSPIANFKRLQ